MAVPDLIRRVPGLSRPSSFRLVHYPGRGSGRRPDRRPSLIPTNRSIPLRARSAASRFELPVRADSDLWPNGRTAPGSGAYKGCRERRGVRPFETFAVSTAAATLSHPRAVLGHFQVLRVVPVHRAETAGRRLEGRALGLQSAIERAWMRRQRRPSATQASWRRATTMRRISASRELDFMLACSQKSWSRMASVRRHSSRPYSVQTPSPQ